MHVWEQEQELWLFGSKLQTKYIPVDIWTDDISKKIFGTLTQVETGNEVRHLVSTI